MILGLITIHRFCSILVLNLKHIQRCTLPQLRKSYLFAFSFPWSVPTVALIWKIRIDIFDTDPNKPLQNGHTDVKFVNSFFKFIIMKLKEFHDFRVLKFTCSSHRRSSLKYVHKYLQLVTFLISYVSFVNICLVNEIELFSCNYFPF